jgi:hypothetical protein
MVAEGDQGRLSLAVLNALAGQIFLVTVVARAGLGLSHRTVRPRKDGTPHERPGVVGAGFIRC